MSTSRRPARRIALWAFLVGLTFVAAACGESDSTTDSTASPAVATTEPTTSASEPTTSAMEPTTPATEPMAPTTTTTPEVTTVATSVEEEGEPAVVGYQVVGVAADDVLNVRAGPSAQDVVVGTFPPDATGVVVTETFQGNWWGVLLEDGTEGFANSRFLAVDDAWTAPFSELPCASKGAAWGESQSSPEPPQPSDVAFVHGYDYLTSPECDRLVIRLAARPEGPATDASNWYASIAAATMPGDIEVTSGSNRVIITFPEDYFDFRFEAVDADIAGAELYAVSPLGDSAKRAVELLYDTERIALARFLDNPARIVVDVKPSPNPSGMDYSPITRGLFVLTEPALWDGTISGTDQPITITGFGRPYESWGIASLSRLDGDADIEALWTGGYDCAHGDSQGGPGRGDFYCFMAAWEVWGEFSFTIDELPPGSYRLSIADECAAGNEADCSEFEVHHDFTISP